MEELLALLGIGGGGLLVGDAYNTLGETGETAWSESQKIGDAAADLTSFKGYGVTGPSGGGVTNEGGSTAFNLSPDQQAYADFMRNQSMLAGDPNSAQGQYARDAFGGASSMIPGITGDTTGREQDIYDRIRAMQSPEEMRQQTALGSRLAAQGRTGLTTGAYGGSPEQLALDKARAEAMNSASYEAIRLAQQDQLQGAQIASNLSQTGTGALTGMAGNAAQYGGLQYTPQQMLMDMYNTGSQAYSFEDIARRNAANSQAEAYMGGLEGMLGANLGQANLMGEIGSGLVGGGMGMLSSAINNGASTFGDIWTNIKGAF